MSLRRYLLTLIAATLLLGAGPAVGSSSAHDASRSVATAELLWW